MRSQASENQMSKNQAHKCFPTSNSVFFLQGSDLELLFWEADTGKRIDWDDVSRYHLETLSPNGHFLSLRKFKQESSVCLPQIGLGK